MKIKKICIVQLVFISLLTGFPIDASAAINNRDLLDNVISRYSTAASSWSTVITNEASWLFWTLVVIAMVWTFGMMALRRADLGEFFAEFVRFTVFTGFFWWLLVNGPNFADSIIRSLRMLAGNASGLGPSLTPSHVVDVGFGILDVVLKQSSIWSVVNSTVGIIMAVVILVILALVGVNMLLLLIASWILMYAGVFFLGFGGSRWTSDMAIGYYRTVLSVAAQLFVMVLIVGIGQGFLNDYYASMSKNLQFMEMAVIIVASVILLVLVSKVPQMVGQLAYGAGGGAGGGTGIGNLGAGAALGAASMVGTAAVMLGAGAVAAGTQIAGGSNAIMAAIKQACGNVAEGTDIISSFGGGGKSSSGSGGEGSSSGESPFAAAAGFNTSGSGGAEFSSGFGESSTGSGGETESGAGTNRGFGESSTGSGGEGSSSGGETESGAGTNRGFGESSTGSGGEGSFYQISSGGETESGAGTNRGFMPTAGRIAVDTAANLAIGVGRVLRTKAAAMIQDTPGGKIAAAIKQGKEKYEPEKEIADFVNKVMPAGDIKKQGGN